jgi:hypothetical protein
VAALAQDPDVLERTGQLLSSWELGREYGFTDYDGRRPDWGRLELDLSGLPPSFLEILTTGLELQLVWLNALSRRTKQTLARFTTSKRPGKGSRRKPTRGEGG